MKLPVESAKGLAETYGLRQVILVAWDGAETHVVTYGESVEDSDGAAEGGNFIKKALNWPGSLQAESPKVTALRAELAQALGRVKELETNFWLYHHTNIADGSDD
jgi:hypothetical protein